ncbi:unnamed protein product [Lactuca saligna]|uniref:Uncharacterized protein n=1 Tax=Lactuca saligna TaxID=75948 RepID=A0AA35ZG48_LACSI|nr:unnamed protein product [Lactuca saligna]
MKSEEDCIYNREFQSMVDGSGSGSGSGGGDGKDYGGGQFSNKKRRLNNHQHNYHKLEQQKESIINEVLPDTVLLTEIWATKMACIESTYAMIQGLDIPNVALLCEADVIGKNYLIHY